MNYNNLLTKEEISLIKNLRKLYLTNGIVKVDDIINDLGIKVKETTYIMNGSYKAQYFEDNGDYVIELHYQKYSLFDNVTVSNFYKEQRNFVMAHCLGHYFLNEESIDYIPDIEKLIATSNPKLQKATLFAINLLIDQKDCEGKYYSEIKKKYNIPESVLKFMSSKNFIRNDG